MFLYYVKKYATPFFLISLLFFLASAVFLLVFIYNPTFADALNQTFAQGVRMVLAKLTSLLPFSLAELLICLSPILVGLLVFCFFRFSNTKRKARRFFLNILGALFLVASLYVFTLGIGYHTTRLDTKMNLTREKIEKEELLALATHLHNSLENDLGQVAFSESGASVMPYSVGELSALLSDEYDRFVKANSSIISFNYSSRVKGVFFSRAMSYAQILGIYTFFTGESNVNVDYPDAEIPTTALHEMAHQRGISREDEASFVAFLVGRNSSDAYVRYSCNLDLFRYILNALWRADPEGYREFWTSIDKRIVGDIVAISEHSRRFQNHPIGNISSSLNDAYLKANGTEGAVSYGFIVDLAVAYYKDTFPDLFD